MVSCICTTYRRFFCLKRVLAMWFSQDYKNKELIIFNTDIDYPIRNSDFLIQNNIKIINNNINYLTGKPYTNTGSIRRDAVTHASGDYFMLWDDDDIYLHFHLRQAVEQIQSCGKKAWKPFKSFFKTGNKLEYTGNYMEASVIVEMNQIRKYGFNEESATESLSWYHALKDQKELSENHTFCIPSYCFNWSDPYEIGGHKQSSTTEDNKFDIHKQRCTDKVIDELVPSYEDMDAMTISLYRFIHDNKEMFPKILYKKYIL